jgi:hypothetical protein
MNQLDKQADAKGSWLLRQCRQAQILTGNPSKRREVLSLTSGERFAPPFS